MFQGNDRISGSSTSIHQQRSTFWVFFFERLFAASFLAQGICRCDARKMQALGFSAKTCGLAFPYKVGPYDRYKWSYNSYKCPYKWVTGVITPINGYTTAGGGPLTVYIQSYRYLRVLFVVWSVCFWGPNFSTLEGGPGGFVWRFDEDFSLRIQVCPKKGINPTILLWRWDWDHQTYSRKGYGSLGFVSIDKMPQVYGILASENWHTYSRKKDHVQKDWIVFQSHHFSGGSS